MTPRPLMQLPHSHAFLAVLVVIAFVLFINLETRRLGFDHQTVDSDNNDHFTQFVGGGRRKALQLHQNTPPKVFTKVPEGHEKTFYYDGKAISKPAVRALRSRGWRKVNHPEDAQLFYFYGDGKPIKKLQPWQRWNHVPNSYHWNSKDYFVEHYNDYSAKTGIVPYYLPQSFLLYNAADRKAFRRKVEKEGGINFPWVLKEPDVNQGKGIEIVPPNSERLVEIAHLKKDAPEASSLIQQYICNELTWNQRKFDVRMFWFVASVDPLVVLYQDGYARIGNSVYKEDDFDNTVAHLTTHTGLGEEGKATYSQFQERIRQHHAASPHLQHISDPVAHVKNQFKDSLAEFVAAFKEVSFSPSKQELAGAENVFGFYGADFILDNDLDVWLIEPQKGCGLDEDYDFRIEMHDRLFRGMVDTLEEIWHKQEAGKPILPLENTGQWEVIYSDGWRFTANDYERSKNKKSCSVAQPKKKEE